MVICNNFLEISSKLKIFIYFLILLKLKNFYIFFNFHKLFLNDNCNMNKNQTLSDPFWFNDIYIIIRGDRLTEFFPTKDQTLEERFNALVRLSLYSSIILFYYHKNYRYFNIFIAALLITYFIHINNENVNIPKNNQNVSVPENNQNVSAPENNQNVNVPENSNIKVESFQTESCTKPTLDNPFMNVTMKDYLNEDPKTNAIVDRPKACDISDETVKKSMDDMFNNNLFKDVNDVFGKMNSQRQFYTMPNTQIPNAQDDFAKWLYMNPKTCKEDQNFCLKYEDVRAKRPVFVDPLQNPVNTKKETNANV